MNNFSDTVLTKILLLVFKSFAVLGALVIMFDNCIIKTISSNAKSQDEPDCGKQYFLGQTTAKLQAVFYLYALKSMEMK